jgi:hypothetical protein
LTLDFNTTGGTVSCIVAVSQGENFLFFYFSLSLVIPGYPWLSLVIPGYPWLSLVIPGYPWLSLVIPGYLWLSQNYLI